MHAQIPLDLSRRRDTRTTSPHPYRLPHVVRDRLQAALKPFRNAERAFALAVFLGRFWSMPGRVALPFPIDRRALADRQDLALTEAMVRGAIKTLEAVGFLARWETTGSRYKATPDGLHRKPIPFTFGPEFMPLLIAANRRAAVARGGQEGARRRPPVDTSRGPSLGLLEPPGKKDGPVPNYASLEHLKLSHNSPKGKAQAEPALLMGENLTPLPQLSAAALRVFGKAGAKWGGRG
jgi:hypothetical protein